MSRATVNGTIAYGEVIESGSDLEDVIVEFDPTSENIYIVTIPFDAEAYVSEHLEPGEHAEIASVALEPDGTAIVVTVLVDSEALVQEAAEAVDLSGIGADGDSQYNVSDTQVEIKGDSFEITVYADRESGKFVSNDEIEEKLIEAIDGVEGLST